METNNPLLIVIDPGHGGYDNGAQWEGRLEKDDNLRLGLKVRDALLHQGVDTLMTRDTDEFISLADRAQMANQADADLFVAIHRNSYTEQTPSTNGLENYIYLTAPEATSGKAAQLVLDAVVGVAAQSDRGVNRGNYYVLRRTNMPAMLLEMGFIINEEDNRLFDEYIDQYAEAIARGIMEYFGLEYIPPIQTAVPPIGTLPTQPPETPVPPIGTVPPVTPIPPIGATRPPRPVVKPIPPIGTVPPVKPIPPVGTVPPVKPIPPVGTVPPVKPVPPIGTAPPVKPVPPIGTLPPRPISSDSSRSGLISEGQRALNSTHSADLTADGVYGPSTRQAVIRALQRELSTSPTVSLSVDGIFGPQLRAALPTLRQGDQGQMVVLLQILLYLNGYDPGSIDGNFGSRLKTAVSTFQRDNFLVPDGVAGPTVFAYLLR